MGCNVWYIYKKTDPGKSNVKIKAEIRVMPIQVRANVTIRS